MIARRRFLTLTAAVAALPLLGQRVWSNTSVEFDGLRIDTLSDGQLTLPPSFAFAGLDADLVAASVARHGLGDGALTPPCNLTLLRDGSRTILFDVGAGSEFMDGAGLLPEALALLDLTPEDITDVVFTHGHPDHLWGLLDDFDEPIFPDAAYHMGAAELAYWTDPETVNTIGEERLSFVVGAARRLEVVADRIHQFADGDVILDHITARLTPGHTPGHMSFQIGSEQPLLILGDAIGNHHIAFDAPDAPLPSDQDPQLGAETRSALLAELADSGMRIAGFHLPDGGIGHVERDGDGYRFVPATS